MKKHECFTVLGNPFFSIGGQLHNSSSYAIGLPELLKSRSDCDRTFLSLKEIGANTAAVPVCWNAFEPEEGVFHASYLRRIIDKIREHNLHGILLWFGTWKNGQMEYTPEWVKRDRKRFPRVMCKDGTVTTVLSPHSRSNLEQDCNAFCELMRILKDYDEATGTIIAVQVENEPGMYAPTRRDFSPEGNEAFAQEVPKEIKDLGKAESGAIKKAWETNGCREYGSWQALFGTSGAELCTAFAIASYINKIACKGKTIYDIFMYTNAWMDRNGARGFNLGGLEYPCGGPVSKTLPLWYRVCDALDAIGPDVYEMEPDAIKTAQSIYSNRDNGWPLYIPESGLTSINATLLFEAVGKHGAIGYHIFGVESGLAADGSLSENARPILHSFTMLNEASELILKYAGTAQITSFVQNIGQDSQYLEIGNRKCRISFTGMAMEYAGWVPIDCHHTASVEGQNHLPLSLTEETGRGLLFQAGENEFFLVGHKIRLFFIDREPEDGSIPATWLNNQHQAHHMELLRIEEGHFEHTEFVVDRIRSGDEARHGIWAQWDCGIVHFILGET